MGRITLADARPGMTIVRPVVTSNGVVLVQANTALTDALLDRLRTLGVGAVMVAGGERAPMPQAERLALLDERFRGHEGDALMTAFKQIVADQIRGGA